MLLRLSILRSLLILVFLVSAGFYIYHLIYYKSEDLSFHSELKYDNLTKFEKVGVTANIVNNDNTNNSTSVRPSNSGDLYNSNIKVQKMNDEDIGRITSEIREINEEQLIHNFDKFGALTSETFVIVIQIHRRKEHLNLLLQSLMKCPGINDSLIIFSHDFYSPEVNKEIRAINFTRVMQIFLPYTRQVTPELFPPEEVVSGHLSVGNKILTRQHFWWKANFVFSGLKVLEQYGGVIHFFEEDFYVVPDYIYMMKRLEELMKNDNCFGCNVLIAGQLFYGEDIASSWGTNISSHNIAIVVDLQHYAVNRGLAFNRTIWTKLKGCEKMFCGTLKEPHWDYALMEISDKCLHSHLVVIAPDAPRLLHIGNCGMNYRVTFCNPLLQVNLIRQFIWKRESSLFPSEVYLSEKFIKTRTGLRGSGIGFSEQDSKLCFLLGSLVKKLNRRST